MSNQKKEVVAREVKEDLSITWHAMSTEDVLKKLNTAYQDGLSSEEAARRLEKYGPNQLVEKPRPGFFQLVWEQLKSFVIMLLVVAAVISLLLGEYVDAGAILAIVVLNAVLGVVQESRAEEALAALKKMAAPEAQILRDGHHTTVPASKLVPGDVVFLEAGSFVPADLRLIEAMNLQIDEAALTGESVPVSKNAALKLESDIPLGDRKNTAFMGTTATYGRARGVVVGTGMNTQLGMIADMLQSVEAEETPLQQRLDHLGKVLGVACLIICALVFLLGFVEAIQEMGFTALFQTNAGLEKVVDLFMVAVSLAIAAVPEGLPAVVTISLALGMTEMVRRHALIRRLSSVETLGSATVICSDKTGTLTQNEMTVTRIWADGTFVEVTGSGYSIEGKFKVDGKEVDIKDYPAITTALWVGVLNNDAQLEKVETGEATPSYRMVGDPTEGSILVAAAKAGAYAPDLNVAYPREDEIPFDSSRKRMVTVHAVRDARAEDISPFSKNGDTEYYAIAVKGAPDIVLGLCNRYQTANDTAAPMTEEKRAEVLAANDKMTGSALRVLGLAYRVLPVKPAEINSDVLEKDLIFVGMVGMIDPARTEVSPALNTARSAGIRTIMITGDYPNTAKAIAETIGLLTPGHKVMTGAELNTLSDEQLAVEVEQTDVFARVSPEHKMRIVDALRANDEVVAMTGDGVNDAPAIKRADIGVAMGITGTDVAKGTADMVLTDDNYASIVSAIEQGRIIYSNIRKFVYYLVSCNIGEILIIFLGTLFWRVSPLTAIQLLWLNLVTDGAPALALATEKGDPDIMDQKPRPPKEPIINKTMLRSTLVVSIAVTIVVLAAFYIGKFTDPEHVEFAETMAFLTLSLAELPVAFTARSEFYPLVKLGFFKNKWMNYAVLASVLLVLATVYVPFLNPIFNTVPLGWAQWAEILPLILLPAIVAEINKFVYGLQKKNKKA